MDFLKNKHQNIIIVDDTPQNIKVIGTILRKEGFMISIAQSGKQALEIIEQESPDLILLDIIMPDMDGFEVCKRLKENPVTKDVPVIFLTALSGTEHTVKGFEVGAVDYVTKPIQREELMARVKTHLTIKAYREHLKEEVNIRTKELENRTSELEMANNQLISEIVERKQAENELMSLRNMLVNIIDSMPSVIVGVDSEGIVTQWNREAEKVTGVIAKDAIGHILDDVFPDIVKDMGKVHQACRERMVQKEERVARGNQGDMRYSDVMVYPLVTDGAGGAVIRVDDVTEKVRMEEMMVQSEKMLSVGGLAAGIAHEINNPLAGMMQTADVVINRLSKNIDNPANLKAAATAKTSMEAIKSFMEAREIPKMITTISETGQRIANIVENILNFARKSEGGGASYILGELLDKTLELIMTDYNLEKHYDFKEIDIRKEYEDKKALVFCEGDKIQQVLLNVLRNAAQAMHTGETKNPKLIVRTYVETSRKMVCMEIEDNGPGMDEATHKQVFEPFFTTKPVGIGTGLGMSVAYFIITENHGGEMEVESHPGSGAKFTIRLPFDGRSTSV